MWTGWVNSLVSHKSPSTCRALRISRGDLIYPLDPATAEFFDHLGNRKDCQVRSSPDPGALLPHRMAILTAGVHQRVRVLLPSQAPSILQRQHRSAASTMEAPNTAHLNAMSCLPHNEPCLLWTIYDKHRSPATKKPLWFRTGGPFFPTTPLQVSLSPPT